ncbi:cryptochrome/photolyase family protein [Aestuariivirga litoralis]|uniref:cryptochrome/photolyase family protein n=1 Tax=Aestuariivirga litoralis TaxID=2650924 RepID=UPI0018C47325|nr:cryptochrome/photolyase family protein [Aestuariivirga litoralis]MBG1232781.1 cryptochrome/photolyase family protein [Aestuariivirga litoralis]
MARLDHKILLITGDQLSLNLSALRAVEPAHTHILLAEVVPEATTAKHHKKKIVLVFSAMRHFAEELRRAGWNVDYVTLDDPENSQSLSGEVKRAMTRHQADTAVMTAPNDYRLRGELAFVEQLEDNRFFSSEAEFRSFAETHKNLRMEFFYRALRQKTGLLMENGQPVGGRWNYDTENRKPAKSAASFVPPPRFEPNVITREVIDLVKARFDDHYGLLEPFWFGVTRSDTQAAFESFLKNALPHFGVTQDAMLENEYFLNHSMISLYLNLGLLDARMICKAAEAAYLSGDAPLESVEGFIRQILGWREYVRGVYWMKMPDYLSSNFLKADVPIPDFYWSGDTDLNCVSQALRQTHDEAYAHHIQRLMITGNFALLAGINPFQVHEWYHAVYADAFEWVEAPNTIGMALHADGGLMGSKPYAASANYINKMSNYCKACRYDPKQRLGPEACPFNAMYWNFIGKHQDVFSHNLRMGQIVNAYRKFSADEKQAIANQANGFIGRLKPY